MFTSPIQTEWKETSMAILIGMSEGIKGKTYEIEEGRTTIGRNSTNILAFDNATISGRHCEIRKEDKRFKISDLGSTNGTRVNSREIDEAPLRPKDLVQIGAMEFMFDAEDSEIEKENEDYKTNVEVSDDPARTPDTFNSISPFGSRKNNQKIWYFLVGAIGVIALVVVVLFVVKLLAS